MSSQQNIARAPARARAQLLGHKLDHSRCGSERARRRCGGSAETPPSCMPPMVTPLANVRLRGRRPLCVAAVAPPASRAFPVGVLGKRPPAHNRPPKLAPAPSNAHKQPYPPTPQKKIRARAKAATKTLAPRPRALPRGPTCMWPFQPRGLPSTRWTLARAHAAAAPALQKPLTKRRKRFRGLRARPLTARRCPTLCRHKRAYLRRRCPSTHVRLAPSPWLPFCAFPSHASQFAVCL